MSNAKDKTLCALQEEGYIESNLENFFLHFFAAISKGNRIDFGRIPGFYVPSRYQLMAYIECK